MKIFKKYGFNSVDMQTLGVYSNYDQLLDDLEREFVRVSGQSIAKAEEGQVIYFVKRDKEQPNRDDILSLTKVKTLEYRLFRKLREKLRNYTTLKTQATADQCIEKFIKESKALIRGFPIPQDLDYYIDLAVTAFNMITKGPKKD